MVFKRFQEFKALMLNQTGKKINVLKSYNVGEYTCNEFNNLCARESIKTQLTDIYNPWQNGVVERKSRAIIGVARAKLHD